MSTFTVKNIEVHLTLANDTFRSKRGSNKKIVRALPIQVTCTKAGVPDRHSCTIRIKNMLMEDMEQLTTLGSGDGNMRQNLVDVFVGQNDMAVLFSGEIYTATVDFSAVPDVSLVIESVTGIYPALTASKGLSIDGTVPLDDVMQQLSAAIGYDFINEGFTGQLRNSVLLGSPMEQVQQAAREAGASLIIDDRQIIVKEKKEARRGNPLLVSPASGMIGYPSFENDGIRVDMLFTPVLRYGQLFKIESIVPKASGVWEVTKLSYNLSVNEAQKESWKMTVHGKRYE